MEDLEHRRIHMVEAHLARRGISNLKTLEAFRSVPREAFVPEELAEFAYEDTPLPIGEGQTMSGYAAALLGQIAKDTYTVERLEPLATSAGERLRQLGYSNVHVLRGDGSLGWPVRFVRRATMENARIAEAIDLGHPRAMPPTATV